MRQGPRSQAIPLTGTSIRTVIAIVHRTWKMQMNNLLDEGWATVARLQNDLSTTRTDSARRAFDLLIDRQLDRIEMGVGATLDDQHDQRRLIGTANRRDRHRARLTTLHLVAPAISEQVLAVSQDHETALQARDAIRQILTQSSASDSALLLSVAFGKTASSPLSDAAARKRLSRLRARFSHLQLEAA